VIDRERFLVHVEVTPTCWLWIASTKPNGYGQVRRRGRTLLAHRLAYELFVGPIPAGLSVLHRCDEPACVNPAHLFLGTHDDNMADMVAKGRQCRGARMSAALHGKARGRTRGTQKPNAKLTDERVRAIRAAYAAGETQTSIAARHSVRQSLISRVVRREAWSHV
jgi:hypothetical protein